MAVVLMGNPHDAEDVVQNTFVVAADKISRIPKQDPWPWLAGTLVNEARNARRSRARRMEMLSAGKETHMNRVDDKAVNPADAASQSEQFEQLHHALRELPDPQREAISLTFFSELSLRRAAELLGQSASTVNDRVHSGMDRLRKRLGTTQTQLAQNLSALPIVPPIGGWHAAKQLWLANAGMHAAANAGGAYAAKGKSILVKTAVAGIGALVALFMGICILLPRCGTSPSETGFHGIHPGSDLLEGADTGGNENKIGLSANPQSHAPKPLPGFDDVEISDGIPSDLEEEPSTIIEGRVVYGAKRSPLGHIAVRIAQNGKLVDSQFTNEDGRFYSSVAKGGEYRLKAYPFDMHGLAPETTLVVEEDGKAFAEIVVPDRLVNTLFGTVSRKDGTGIQGVEVRVIGACGAFVAEGVATSGKGGAFDLGDVLVSLHRPKGTGAGVFDPHDFDNDDDIIDFLVQYGLRKDIRPVLLVMCDHPDYERKFQVVELKVRDRTVRLALGLTRVGRVGGSVTVSAGESLEGKKLPYRFEMGKRVLHKCVDITNGEFHIRFTEAGRLILGGLVGRFWVDDVDVGRVDTRTKRKGIALSARPLEIHTISLYSSKGVPLTLSEPEIYAMIEVIPGGRSEHVRIVDGRIRIPIFFKKSRRLSLWGDTVPQMEILLHADRLPDTLPLNVRDVQVILKGRVVFPTGFKNWGGVKLDICGTNREGKESGCFGKWEFFGDKTGEFTLKSLPEIGPHGVYRVSIHVPGYKRWVKEEICVKEGESAEWVLVTFEK